MHHLIQVRAFAKYSVNIPNINKQNNGEQNNEERNNIMGALLATFNFCLITVKWQRMNLAQGVLEVTWIENEHFVR